MESAQMSFVKQYSVLGLEDQDYGAEILSQLWGFMELAETEKLDFIFNNKNAEWYYAGAGGFDLVKIGYAVMQHILRHLNRRLSRKVLPLEVTRLVLTNREGNREVTVGYNLAATEVIPYGLPLPTFDNVTHNDRGGLK